MRRGSTAGRLDPLMTGFDPERSLPYGPRRHFGRDHRPVNSTLAVVAATWQRWCEEPPESVEAASELLASRP
jgi:hypothetical protein